MWVTQSSLLALWNNIFGKKIALSESVWRTWERHMSRLSSAARPTCPRGPTKKWGQSEGISGFATATFTLINFFVLFPGESVGSWKLILDVKIGVPTHRLRSFLYGEKVGDSFITYRARKNGLLLPRSIYGCKPLFRPLYDKPFTRDRRWRLSWSYHLNDHQLVPIQHIHLYSV